MENLPRVIAAYQGMDQARRVFILDYMERVARTFPRREPLRLVVNNRGGHVNRHAIQDFEDEASAIIVRAPKDTE